MSRAVRPYTSVGSHLRLHFLKLGCTVNYSANLPLAQGVTFA